jgi:hypothetical protein
MVVFDVVVDVVVLGSSVSRIDDFIAASTVRFYGQIAVCLSTCVFGKFIESIDIRKRIHRWDMCIRKEDEYSPVL